MIHTQFSKLAALMIELTKKKKTDKTIWTPECQYAFLKLKEVLTSKPVLIAPDFEKECSHYRNRGGNNAV